MKYLIVMFNKRNEAKFFEHSVGKYYSLDKIEKSNETEYYVKCDKVEITRIKDGLVYLFFDLGHNSFTVPLSVKAISDFSISDIWHSK